MAIFKKNMRRDIYKLWNRGAGLHYLVFKIYSQIKFMGLFPLFLAIFIFLVLKNSDFQSYESHVVLKISDFQSYKYKSYY